MSGTYRPSDQRKSINRSGKTRHGKKCPTQQKKPPQKTKSGVGLGFKCEARRTKHSGQRKKKKKWNNSGLIPSLVKRLKKAAGRKGQRPLTRKRRKLVTPVHGGSKTGGGPHARLREWGGGVNVGIHQKSYRRNRHSIAGESRPKREHDFKK